MKFSSTFYTFSLSLPWGIVFSFLDSVSPKILSFPSFYGFTIEFILKFSTIFPTFEVLISEWLLSPSLWKDEFDLYLSLVRLFEKSFWLSMNFSRYFVFVEIFFSSSSTSFCLYFWMKNILDCLNSSTLYLLFSYLSDIFCRWDFLSSNSRFLNSLTNSSFLYLWVFVCS